MKSLLVALSSAIMAAYVVYRGVTTVVFLPFTTSLFSPTGVYFLALSLVAAGTTALSFTRRKGIAAVLATIIGISALSFWGFVIAGPWRTWSEFVWLVVPELCFLAAGLCKWWVARSRTLPEARLEEMLK